MVKIDRSSGVLSLLNPVNISNNEGYDNQPSFYDNQTILFASTRNAQTDIAKYDIASKKSVWVNDTKIGSEYSPTKIPNKEAISSIRLDTTGLQRLYNYSLKGGNSTELIENLKIGYHLWYSPNVLVATVLVENRMDLVVADLKTKTHKVIQEKVGRSLHKIPNSELISFVKVGEKSSTLMSYDSASGETTKIIDLTPKSQDVCWLNDGTLLTGYGKSILKFNPKTDENWSSIAHFTDKNINNISRLAVNENNNKLVLVAEESPENIVQKQVETFNKGHLDAFVSNYSENVLVQRFPNDTMYLGKTKMKANYKRYMANNPDTKVKVIKRIVLNNTVIDEELATVAGKSHKQVAIYEVANGRISSMTFIHDKPSDSNTEKVVQDQLDAYNSRNIKGFASTYSDDVKVYNFPNELRFEGIDKMREQYGPFFESTPDLHCEIKNRVVIGNKVIDEEFVTMNGNNFSAIAIYEVENGKIVKVTFVR